MRRPVRTILVAFLAGSLGACSFLSAPVVKHGIHVDADDLKELVPGTSTRADVQQMLGTPTARATFDDNIWIYVAETTQTRIGQMAAVRSQDVVQLTFDQRGVLHDVKHLDQDDSQPVSVVSRTTASPGTEATFLQQLLGNIGRFTPNAGTTSGGAPGLSAGGM